MRPCFTSSSNQRSVRVVTAGRFRLRVFSPAAAVTPKAVGQ